MLVFSLALAGCAGDSAPKSSSDAAPVPTADDSTGSVTGRILTDELQPIQGADVGIRGQPSFVAQSDVEGRFTFNGVAPGRINIDAQKLGYSSAAKPSDIVAGEVVEVQIILTPIAVQSEGYPQMIPLKAYMQFGATTPALTLRPGILLNDKLLFSTQMNKGVRTAYTEMVWQSSAPLSAKKMRLDTVFDGKAGQVASSKSPLIYVNEDINTTKKMNLDYSIWLPFLCATCVEEAPDNVVVVVYEQKFDIYLTLFFGMAPPVGYSAVPK